MHGDIAKPPLVWRSDVRGHNPIVPLRIMSSKHAKILRSGAPKRPFAFNGNRRTPAAAPDKVDFVILLVPPIANLLATLGESVNFV